jgi:hypothetical protein
MGKETNSIPPGSRKPVVGVVYSDGSKEESLESKHMGLYLAGHIASTGTHISLLLEYPPDSIHLTSHGI